MDLVIVRHCAGATGTRPEDRFLPPNHAAATDSWLAEARAAGYNSYELDAFNGKVLAHGNPQFAPDCPPSVPMPDSTKLVQFPRRRIAYVGHPLGLGPDWRREWDRTLDACWWATHVAIDAMSDDRVIGKPENAEIAVRTMQAGKRLVVEAMVPESAPSWMREACVMFRAEWLKLFLDGGASPPYVHWLRHPEAFCLWDGAPDNFPSTDQRESIEAAYGPAKPETMALWCRSFVDLCRAAGIVPMLSADWAGGPAKMRAALA